MSDAAAPASFSSLELPQPLVAAIEEIGYELPSPIQAQTIPLLLQGKDVLGHAPTGTGKTAAFALPLLARIDLKQKRVQMMVLTPTRELAIQVSEALQRYASKLPDFHVLPVYGGQDYQVQIRQLKRGVQAVVGTPGRIMDHMRRGTLKLDGLQSLVLDEADEMLRMGFIDDVEWILEQIPGKQQMALFSATMPKEVERIARRHLHEPRDISIKAKTATAESIHQRYWMVSGLHKLDALTRILEVETYDALLIFVRTKVSTVELASKLEARGHSAAALNGDMPQKQREMMIEKLKRGTLDILVATDVAARGLDVERISHVVNFDIPYDTEAYIHRIGRTGRAGRSGEAILFVTPREQRLLRSIEKLTRQRIEPLQLPTTEMVNNKRISDFKQSITDTLAKGETAFMQNLLEQYRQEHNVPSLEIASALATMLIGDKPLLLKAEKRASGKKDKSAAKANSFEKPQDSSTRTKAGSGKTRSDKPRPERQRDPASEAAPAKPRSTVQSPLADKPPLRRSHMSNSAPTPKETVAKAAPSSLPTAAAGMELYRMSVGAAQDITAANIVGTVASEAGLDSVHIGKVQIENNHSFIELPEGMPKSIFRDLKKSWICGHRMGLTRCRDDQAQAAVSSAKSENKKTKTNKGAKKRKDKGAPASRKPGGKKIGKGAVKKGKQRG